MITMRAAKELRVGDVFVFRKSQSKMAKTVVSTAPAIGHTATEKLTIRARPVDTKLVVSYNVHPDTPVEVERDA
jgi:hypothetical protein